MTGKQSAFRCHRVRDWRTGSRNEVVHDITPQRLQRPDDPAALFFAAFQNGGKFVNRATVQEFGFGFLKLLNVGNSLCHGIVSGVAHWILSLKSDCVNEARPIGRASLPVNSIDLAKLGIQVLQV